MNALLLLAALTVGEFRADDFYYYNDARQPKGLALQNCIFIDTEKQLDKEKLEKFLKNFPNLKEMKSVEKEEYKGIILTFETKGATLSALNAFTKEYGDIVHPIVRYNDLDVIAINQVLVQLKPGVNKQDYAKRLSQIADAKFSIVEEHGNNIVIVSVKDLNNPANIFSLANLMAQDSFWTVTAMVHWLPVNGFVTANMTIETDACTDLGHTRILKLTINVYDPKINLRLDLLPIVGQGMLQPFPYNGDIWIDAEPFRVTEFSDNYKKTVIVEYPFKYLQFGNFVFQPIQVSYEINGKMYEAKTDVCRFYVSSVINGMDIEDIQPVVDRTKLELLPLQDPPVMNPLPSVYRMTKQLVGGGLLLTGFVLTLLGVYIGVSPLIRTWFKGKKYDKYEVWRDLLKCVTLPYDLTWKEDYMVVITKLNRVLNQDWNVSVYTIDPQYCNHNFQILLGELDKLYMPEGVSSNKIVLANCLHNFCREKKYD